MPAPAALQRLVSLGLRVAAVLAFLPPLLTRLALGHAFYQTGSGKIENIDRVVSFFTDLGIPFPAANAAFVSRLEYFGGLLLVVGLLTRVVAVMLSGTMVVALLTEDKAGFLQALAGAGENAPIDVTPFAYLVLLLWLAVIGPGVVSLDALIKRWLLPRKPQLVDVARAA